MSAPTPGDLNALANLLVSPLTGILRRLVVLPWEGDQIRMTHMVGPNALYGRLPYCGDVSRPGGSCFNVQDACAKVLFEAVERYAASFADYTSMFCSKPTSELFLFEDLPLYTDEQYDSEGWPFRRLTEDSEIFWVGARSMITGRRRLVPAAFVYVPYKPTSKDEWLGPSTSTGMAGGWSQDSVYLGGLLEVCERDAFKIMWMNRLSMPRLKIEPDSPLGRKVAHALGSTDAKVTFVNITNDLQMPTVAAVLERRLLGKPLVTVGLSCKPTFEVACEKAFAESVSEYERIRVRFLDPEIPSWAPEPDFSNVVDFEWHGLTYAEPELQQHLEFLTASPIEQPLQQDIEFGEGSDRQKLLHALSILEKKVREIVVVDMATRELKEIGVHTVKVMAPDLVPLNADHRHPWLGHRRLFEVPRILGYRDDDSTPLDMNPYPHPFS